MKFIDYLFMYSVTIVIVLCIAIPVIGQIEMISEDAISKDITPIYDTVTKTVLKYTTDIIKQPYQCFDNISKTITCYHNDLEVQRFIGYEEVIISNEIKGFVKRGTIIEGDVYADKDIVSKWKYGLGDNRNFDDPIYQKCLQWEIDKGVCDEF